MPHKITLTGYASSSLRTCRNIFSFDMEESGSAAAPKGLPLSQTITYTVFLNKKQLNKAGLDEKNLRDHKLIVQGEPTLDIPVDECPGEIGIICFQLSLVPAKEQTAENADKATEEEEVSEALAQIAAASIVKEEAKTPEFIVPLEEIIVSEEFLHSNPNPIKTQAVIDYVKKHGHLDQPIWLEKNSLLLVDGYRRYLVAKQLKMSHVPVSYR